MIDIEVVRGIVGLFKNIGIDVVDNKWYVKKPIESKYPGCYHIPNYSGYVINKDTQKVFKINRDGTLKEVTIIVPTGCDTNNNYLKVYIKNDEGVSSEVSVHRLMTYAFHPFKSRKATLINHINGIKTDNRPENLEWCTYSDNINHAYETGLRPSVNKVPCWLESEDGEIVNFKTTKEMTDWMGVHYLVMRRMYDNNTLFKDKWKICFHVPPGSVESMANFQSSPIWVLDSITSEVDEHPSIRSVMAKYGLNKFTVTSNSNLSNENKLTKFPVMGYVFFREKPSEEIIKKMKATEEEAIVFKYLRDNQITSKVAVPFLVRKNESDVWTVAFSDGTGYDTTVGLFGLTPTQLFYNQNNCIVRNQLLISFPFGKDKSWKIVS